MEPPSLLMLPIGSMYAIYGNIYHQYTPNVSIYTSTMDPMGYFIPMFESSVRPVATRCANRLPCQALWIFLVRALGTSV